MEYKPESVVGWPKALTSSARAVQGPPASFARDVPKRGIEEGVDLQHVGTSCCHWLCIDFRAAIVVELAPAGRRKRS